MKKQNQIKIRFSDFMGCATNVLLEMDDSSLYYYHIYLAKGLQDPSQEGKHIIQNCKDKVTNNPENNLI